MNKEKYIKDVLRNIDANNGIKKRITEDLSDRIDSAMEDDPFFNVITSIGEPKDVAQEFMENLDIPQSQLIQIGLATNTSPFEFKSQASLFGLPLIHVNTGGRYSNRTAKGFIAVGDIAMGVISIGGVSFGLVALGGIGIGIIGIGGIGIGVLAAGGVAVGIQAFGGVAVGLVEAFGAVTQVFRNIHIF
jgi:hypothetical protein